MVRLRLGAGAAGLLDMAARFEWGGRRRAGGGRAAVSRAIGMGLGPGGTKGFCVGRPRLQRSQALLLVDVNVVFGNFLPVKYVLFLKYLRSVCGQACSELGLSYSIVFPKVNLI